MKFKLILIIGLALGSHANASSDQPENVKSAPDSSKFVKSMVEHLLEHGANKFNLTFIASEELNQQINEIKLINKAIDEFLENEDKYIKEFENMNASTRVLLDEYLTNKDLAGITNEYFKSEHRNDLIYYYFAAHHPELTKSKFLPEIIKDIDSLKNKKKIRQLAKKWKEVFGETYMNMLINGESVNSSSSASSSSSK